jgi:amino-acid N-acetyltransferase
VNRNEENAIRWRFRSATPADLPRIRALLSSAGLPLAGFDSQPEHFLLAFRGRALAGCALLERHARAALLRSVAVARRERGSGLGDQMVRRLLARARAERLRCVALLTTTAAGYFPRFGFQPVSRARVPAALKATAEFTGACPATATVMRLDLERTRRKRTKA